ncbi:NfeD family protein [Ignatzschineria indica]|uniref:NfeD family protein n=1 Tax=Ignatzschineria indica TaxID=472583 RepID=UPI0025764D57|nr:NfeD family protein [Ignatzschineria indica]MDM1545750.1 NfeD family protein [Ignatzschineria indica]
MIALFSDINPMMLWLIAGALLILFEIILPGVYLFWIGIAALMVGGVLSVIDLSIILQILLFAIFALLAVIVGVKTYKGKEIKSSALNQTRGSEFIGRNITLQEAVINQQGRVALGDSTWAIEGEDLPAGSQIRITAVQGNTLLYEVIHRA